MKLRKLDGSEHGRTRKLWQYIFTEDTKAFLDYYYFIKARENEIYVIEDGNEIRSMLHLNPYLIRAGRSQFIGHYIVAVSTEPSYRGKGFMRSLLVKSMQDMYNRKEMFTFLMPAAEAIYTPYDFRFVYDQQQWMVNHAGENMPVSGRNAEFADAARMAEFFRDSCEDKYQVSAVHDEKYYQTMIIEQQSEGGGVRLMEGSGMIKGMFAYGYENGLEVREALCEKGYESGLQDVIWKMKSEDQEEVTVHGVNICGENIVRTEKKPVIMFRILHLKCLFDAMDVKEGEELDCSFAVLDSILTQNSRIWRLRGGKSSHNHVQAVETENSEGVLTIGALTSYLFGYKTMDEICMEDHVMITPHLAEELEKLVLLNKVFLNEVV